MICSNLTLYGKLTARYVFLACKPLFLSDTYLTICSLLSRF